MTEAASIDALEETILRSLQTLDRIDEFTVPTEQPDDEGLALNM